MVHFLPPLLFSFTTFYTLCPILPRFLWITLLVLYMFSLSSFALSFFLFNYSPFTVYPKLCTYMYTSTRSRKYKKGLLCFFPPTLTILVHSHRTYTRSRN
ncbi:hypothetical protein CC80DRAFT_237492 [Byssothecium circinans]|uniref:Uncharacterized protein n=1 Tax=Byssothecium circinans TaxID=147558 RepID=A0A6A5U9P3_9PLEO|nr:hypothetical protein CC80DRAFT_237492 [Byssothecium circinans]